MEGCPSAGHHPLGQALLLDRQTDPRVPCAVVSALSLAPISSQLYTASFEAGTTMRRAGHGRVRDTLERKGYARCLDAVPESMLKDLVWEVSHLLR